MQLIMQRCISGVDYHVYYDGPTPQLYAANANRSDTDRSDTGMLMSFHCTASGTPASLLVDTGASHAYVSTAFVQRCGFSVEPSTADITLADGTVATCSGTCCVRLRLGRYSLPQLTLHWLMDSGYLFWHMLRSSSIRSVQ